MVIQLHTSSWRIRDLPVNFVALQDRTSGRLDDAEEPVLGGDSRPTSLLGPCGWLAPRKPKWERHLIRKRADWHVLVAALIVTKILDLHDVCLNNRHKLWTLLESDDISGIRSSPGQASLYNPSLFHAVPPITVRFSEGHLKIQDRSSLDHTKSMVIHRRSKVEPFEYE
jgi:hypothetical protein